MSVTRDPLRAVRAAILIAFPTEKEREAAMYGFRLGMEAYNAEMRDAFAAIAKRWSDSRN